jgi:hypothetical protein
MTHNNDYDALAARAEAGELRSIPGTTVRSAAAVDAGRNALMLATGTDNIEDATRVALGRTLLGASPLPPSAQSPEVPQDSAAGEEPRLTAKKPLPKVSFYQESADTDRIRGAILNTIQQEGYRTLSQFLSTAAMKEVERLEQQYNGGKPFPAVAAGGLPQGRPIGGSGS